jgi:hypothetical protein
MVGSLSFWVSSRETANFGGEKRSSELFYNRFFAIVRISFPIDGVLVFPQPLSGKEFLRLLNTSSKLIHNRDLKTLTAEIISTSIYDY